MQADPAVTLKQIAERSGRSLAAVSYALRKHPKIPESTRNEIQRVADSLGYRANPRISNLMAHIRRSRHRPFGEIIAFVWMHTSRSLARRDPFLKAVYSGARKRAQQAGFSLEDFYTDDPGMTNRRLEEILRTRGIVGVVLSPVTTSEATVALDWDWSAFSPAVIGNVTWTPELHHAGHHHYLGMRMALMAMQEQGSSRPAALIEPESNLRAKRAWEAAFLTHHPLPSQARSFLSIPDPDEPTDPVSWVQNCNADALIVSATGLLDTPRLRATCKRRRISLATLYWSQDTRDIAGVDQCYETIAGHAVDLVIAQLNANETGVPDLPRIMLFPGRWISASG